MEVHDAVEGKDHHYSYEGEDIRCLVCGIAWMPSGMKTH
jgi:hypothetical protein